MAGMIKLTDEQVQLLKATGSTNPDESRTAMRALAAALEEPLRKGVFDGDVSSWIMSRQVLAPGADARYSLDLLRPGEEDLNFTAFVMPKQGRIPERHVEGDELWVPTFRVANAIDWDLRFARDSRYDVVQRCLQILRDGYIRKHSEDIFHTVLASADARGLVVNDAVADAGQFTKELVSKMKTAMTRNAGGNGQYGSLTDLCVSMEAVEDIRSWDETEIDPVTRREILQSAGQNMMRLYNVNIRAMTEFGVGQEYQNYIVNVLGRAAASALTGASDDQEFVLGIDKSTNDSFVMPVRQEIQIFDDPTLHRQGRAGFYSNEEYGVMCADNRRVELGTF
jgi:hypothetical protein